MSFPSLFAIIPSNDTRGRATIYQSILIRDGPDRWGESPSIYHVAPYRIFHGARDLQYPDEAFLLSSPRRAGIPYHDVMLVADLPDPYDSPLSPSGRPLSPSGRPLSPSGRLPVRQLFYQGRWEPTGQTIFSLFCATPIPVLELPTPQGGAAGGSADNLRWPAPAYNRLPIIPVEYDFVRIWQRRWELPVELGGERSETTGGRSETTGGRSETAAGGAGATARRLIPVLEPPPPVVSTAPPIPPAGSAIRRIATELPSFVANAIVADAVARGLQCPITMDPIAEITTPVAVTNCYHVFESAAFHAWMRTGDGTCPICKARI